MSGAVLAAIGAAFTWAGLVIGISFIEAPIKFRAPGVTLQIGLGIGRLVFRAMNVLEGVLAAVLAGAVILAARSPAVLIPALTAVCILAAQLAFVRPRLTRRSNAVIAGEGGRTRSRTHHAYIVLETMRWWRCWSAASPHWQQWPAAEREPIMNAPPRSADLPFENRDDDTVQGHWLLARLGKKGLRPGGAELTRTLLDHAQVGAGTSWSSRRVWGAPRPEIISRHPRSYHGIDNDPGAVRAVQLLVEGHGDVHLADAAHTGLEDASADGVVGEAMLTLQAERAKDAIVAEAVRVLRPGGRYAIHELGLVPDELPDEVKTEIRRALARSIKVNARPLTPPEWSGLLTRHGLVIDRVEMAPMALLQPRRLVSDERLGGALRFAGNLLTHPNARRRVLAMRRTFRTHRRRLTAIAIAAHKPEGLP